MKSLIRFMFVSIIVLASGVQPAFADLRVATSLTDLASVAQELEGWLSAGTNGQGGANH